MKAWITDFACVAKKLIVEIDGGYHNFTAENDLFRESVIKTQGWDILRFDAEEVIEDVEVVHAIAHHLDLDYPFVRRKNTGAGTHSDRARS